MSPFIYNQALGDARQAVHHSLTDQGGEQVNIQEHTKPEMGFDSLENEAFPSYGYLDQRTTRP